MFKLFKNLRNQKGFTLVEILVVIVIIGILFTVILPRIDFAGDKARQTGVKTDFRTFTVAAEQYFRESAGNGLNYAGFNSFLDEANKLNNPGVYVEGGIKQSFKKDPWGKAYDIMFKDLDSTKAEIIVVSSGKTGGTFTSPLANTGDFTLAIYYEQGTIETCTKGFGDADLKLAALNDDVALGAAGNCGKDIS